MNFSHTHLGPTVGTWAYGFFDLRADRAYLEKVVQATLEAARHAMVSAREVTVHGAVGKSSIPVSRRLPDAQGIAQWAPNPKGEVCRSLPVVSFQDADGKTICLLFSISCHPSTAGGHAISADYPGAAMAKLDSHFGKPVSLFLQGCGGDAKACVIADGNGGKSWRSGTFEDIDKAGDIAAREVLEILQSGLVALKPRIRCALKEMRWPLMGVTRKDIEAWKSRNDELLTMMAHRLLKRLDQGIPLPTFAPVLAHGIQLAQGLRLIALEGEAVGEFGNKLLKWYRRGVTFPMGYSNGTGLYLPTERMLKEHGYEVDSTHEYGFPASLMAGYEAILKDTVDEFKSLGIR
ncbi:MAG: hypothetical protein HY343_01685 [Lentisphaerae bacterium]|nr:hypothetical protein [Lentisphaerota bacterium]